jgi:hypothetical protein
MKSFLVALATLALALPVGATPTQREIINYDELMVITPNLEHLGYSRISTVDACVKQTGVKDWTSMITDSDLETFEACLVSYN